MRKSIEEILVGFKERAERRKPTDGEFKIRQNAREDIANYFIMTIGMFLLGVIVIIKLIFLF